MKGRTKKRTRKVPAMTLGKVIADYRYVNRIGVRTLAAELDISPATLNRIEHGGEMNAAALVNIWKWLTSPRADFTRTANPE